MMIAGRCHSAFRRGWPGRNGPAPCCRRPQSSAVAGLWNAESSGGLSGSGAAIRLFFKGYGDIGIGRQSHDLALDIRYQSDWDEMVVAFVRALATVLLGELYACTFEPVDSSDMDAVRSDDFHMFADPACINHVLLPSGVIE